MQIVTLVREEVGYSEQIFSLFWRIFCFKKVNETRGCASHMALPTL